MLHSINKAAYGLKTRHIQRLSKNLRAAGLFNFRGGALHARPRSRFLQLHFLDHDPAEGWSDGYATIGDAIEASGLATHVWTGPFVNTVWGTDTYTDELW